jgi:hypothetical protein
MLIEGFNRRPQLATHYRCLRIDLNVLQELQGRGIFFEHDVLCSLLGNQFKTLRCLPNNEEQSVITQLRF